MFLEEIITIVIWETALGIQYPLITIHQDIIILELITHPLAVVEEVRELRLQDHQGISKIQK